MQNKTILWGVIIVLVILAVFILMNRTTTVPDTNENGSVNTPTTTQNNDETPIEENPTEEITYTNATQNDVIVELPFPGAVVGKNFSVIGDARGPWFFEASFPVEVLDKNGVSLAIAIAQAQGEWMTTEFVRFRADIKIPETYIGEATLVLHKDNPSGLPENEASISFPITIEY
jgi:hypothetical protein